MRISLRSKLVRSLILGTVVGAAIFGFLFAAVPAEAVFYGASAYYHPAGTNPSTNPPIGGRLCIYWATVQCQCGWYDSPKATACSEKDVADAELWARAACFQFCMKNDPWGFGEPGPTGIYSPTGRLSQATGVIHAASPGVFQAYAPGSPGAIGESSDLAGLAEQLTQVTGSSTCWLSGPLELFGTASPAPGEAPVVVVP